MMDSANPVPVGNVGPEPAEFCGRIIFVVAAVAFVAIAIPVVWRGAPLADDFNNCVAPTELGLDGFVAASWQQLGAIRPARILEILLAASVCGSLPFGVAILVPLLLTLSLALLVRGTLRDLGTPEPWTLAGPFDTRLRNTEDWEMWIRLAKHGPPAWVCSPLVGYRVHNSNSSLDIAEIVRGTKLIETLHHTTADWGRLHRWLAESCLRSGQRREALGQFARAAVRGQLGGVASDLRDILRRRVERRVRRTRRVRRIGIESTFSGDPWIATAVACVSGRGRSSSGTDVICLTAPLPPPARLWGRC